MEHEHDTTVNVHVYTCNREGCTGGTWELAVTDDGGDSLTT